ncbi:MAG: metallophosphoesterase [Tepidisphaeraceae bacterium]
MNRRRFMLSTLAGAFAAQWRVLARAEGGAATQPVASEFLTDIPAYDGNVLLCRPTDRSITVNACMSKDCAVRVHFGPKTGALTQRTDVMALRANEPQEILLDELQANTPYAYELRDARSGKPFLSTAAGSFRTARPKGESFTFTVQADSHLDDGCRTDIYRQTLSNQLADQPDFMIDMGDTSMAGKHPSRASALRQFLAQRYYFGLVGHSVPSFFVIGNHDGEEAKIRGATDADGLAVWSNAQRKRLFSNPLPNRFYTGSDQPHPHAGLLQNYYAWTWGDALFGVLDPYWTSTSSRGESAGWSMSLGKRQYDWLARTLKQSTARHKIVFIHQLVGGLDNAGRGGAEAAGLFEWGGHEVDGRDTFAAHRPGWAVPIHQLLVQSGVNLVVHGHDHFFADQSCDGIKYLLAPQAAHRNYRSDHADEYGYRAGRFIANSGHLRIGVQRAKLTIDYIRSVPEGLMRRGLTNGAAAATIQVASRTE